MFYVEILDPTPDLCNQEIWELGPLVCVFKSLPTLCCSLETITTLLIGNACSVMSNSLPPHGL